MLSTSLSCAYLTANLMDSKLVTSSGCPQPQNKISNPIDKKNVCQASNSPNSTSLYTITYTSTPPTHLSHRPAHSNSRTFRKSRSTRWYSLCLRRGECQIGDRVGLGDGEGSRLSWPLFWRKLGLPVEWGGGMNDSWMTT